MWQNQTWLECAGPDMFADLKLFEIDALWNRIHLGAAEALQGRSKYVITFV